MPPVKNTGLVYIPTWGRSRIWTIEEMGDVLRSKVRLVVAPGKWSNLLLQRYPSVQQILCPVTTGAAAAKQWILDHTEHESVVTIIDDDVQFQMGSMPVGGKKKFKKATPVEIATELGRMVMKASEPDVGFTSCSTPYFNVCEEGWKPCQQICGVFCINRETMRKSGATFGGIPTREDVWFSAQTWSAGYPSYSHMYFAITNQGDSSLGGESSIDPDTKELSAGVLPRGERTRISHQFLAERFPKFIRLFELVNARTVEVGCTLVMKTRGQAMYRDGLKRRQLSEQRLAREGF